MNSTIKQAIEKVAKKQNSPFAFTVNAEFGYGLAEQEIEELQYEIKRLKMLLIDEHEKRIVSWSVSKELFDIEMQQFKTNNQL